MGRLGRRGRWKNPSRACYPWCPVTDRERRNRGPLSGDWAGRLLLFVERHAWAVIAITAAITVGFGFFALRLRVVPDLDSLIPEDQRINRLIAEYSRGRPEEEFLVLAVQADDPFRLEGLAAFEEAIHTIERLPPMGKAVSPFNWVTFQNEDGRLMVVPVAVEGRAPRTDGELERFRSRLLADPFARNYVVSPDGRTLAAFFAADNVRDSSRIMRTLRQVRSRLDPYFHTYLTGSVPLEHTARTLLMKDLSRLIALVALFVLLIYYVGFRTLRAVLLPLLVVAAGTIWTVGFMAALGYPISMVSVAVPPLVLTLGSSYSIHILNQYYRESGNGGDGSAAAISQVVPTILLASATTIIGFSSLLGNTVRQTRQSALAASVGIAACALVSLTFLPAVLSLLPPPRPSQRRKVTAGLLARLLRRTGRRVVRARYAILVAAVLVAAGFAVAYPHVRHQANYISYFPRQEQVVRDTAAVNGSLGGVQQIYLTFSAPKGREKFFLDPAVLRQIARLEERMRRRAEITYTVSFASYISHLNGLMTGTAGVPEKRGLILLLAKYFKIFSGSQESNSLVDQLLDPDYSRLTVVFRVSRASDRQMLFERELQQVLDGVAADVRATVDPSIEADFWGRSLRFLTLVRIITRDQLQATAVAVVLIFLATLLVFRSLRFAALALVPMTIGIMLNYILMAAIGIPMDVTTVMFTSVAIGVGVDSSIHFLLSVRRQRLARPCGMAESLYGALQVTGRPILLISGSVVGGLLVLTFASFLPIVYFGLLVALALLSTALATVLVLPALLALGERPSSGPGVGEGQERAARRAVTTGRPP